MCAVCMYICVCTVGTFLQAPQADDCQLCKMVVNFIKPFVDSNTTEVRTYQSVQDIHVSLHDAFVSHSSMLMDQSPLSLLSR